MRPVATVLALALATSARAEDVELLSISGPSSLIAGQSFTFTATLRNNDAVAWTNTVTVVVRASADTTYYFADDPEICAQDILGGFGAGQVRQLTLVCTYPSGVSLPYVVSRAILNPNPLAETNALNNDAFYGPVQVAGSGTTDLSPFGLSAPASANAGDVISVGYQLQNTGTLASGAQRTEIRWSNDTVWDSGDTVMCSDSPGSVGAGGSVNRTATGCVVPASATQGTRWILVRADADNVLTETNEGNNTASRAIDLLPAPAPEPDLRLTSLTGPATVDQGSSITMTYTVRNDGTATASAAVLALRASFQSTYDASRPLLCQTTVPSLAAGASTTSTVSGCAFPGTTPAGPGYVVARVDDNGVVVESNEGNNTNAHAIEVTVPGSGGTDDRPNLTVGTVSPLGSTPPELPFSVGYTLANQGDTAAGPSRTAVWLSLDDAVGGDILLCDERPSSVGAGALDGRALSDCVIPAGTTPGNWRVLVQVDADGEVAEVNESDNVAAISLLVEPAGPTDDTGPGDEDSDTPNDSDTPDDSDAIVDSDPTDDTGGRGFDPKALFNTGPCGCGRPIDPRAPWVPLVLAVPWCLRRRRH